MVDGHSERARRVLQDSTVYSCFLQPIFSCRWFLATLVAIVGQSSYFSPSLFPSSRILLILLHSRFSIQLLKPLPRLCPSDRPAEPRTSYLSDHYIKYWGLSRLFNPPRPRLNTNKRWRLPPKMWKHFGTHWTIEEMGGLMLPRGLESTKPGGKRGLQCGRLVWRALGLNRSDRFRTC